MVVTNENSESIVDKGKNTEEKWATLPDPLTLHHSDIPGLVLVSTQLNGRNYGEWSRAMRRSLNAKNKLGLIDGSLEAPLATDAKFHLWRCCNNLVLSWILNSIQPDIARSVAYSNTAAAIWNELSDRFSQGDESRIYKIQQEISECRQGSLSVSAYYTKLKGLWDELGSHQEPIACSCDMLKKLAEREEKEKVMQFLMGLNELYSQIRGSILMMKPLPDTRKTHGLIIQQERQIEVANRRKIPPAALAVTRAQVGGPETQCSSGQRKICTHCEQAGHLVDQCYYLISFPVGHKWHGKNVKPRNKTMAAHNVEIKRESTNESPTFTAEEYQQIMVMLRGKNGNTQPFANATGRGYEEDDWPGQAF